MAESIKQVFDIRPGKGMSDGQSNEHQRNLDGKRLGMGDEARQL